MSSPLRHFRTEARPAGGTTVWMDVAGKPVNIFWDEVLIELESLVDQWEQSSDESPIVIRSAKVKGFAAGADLKRIAAFQSEDEVDTFLLQGQQVLNRLEKLSRPTVAVISGHCLGGGLEMAMSCRYRFVIDEATSIQIGLPETLLGLIPGWGGTQRLPRLVGLSRALDMLLSGEATTIAEELYGLVDDILQEPYAEQKLTMWIKGIVAGNGPETSVPQVLSASDYEAIFTEKEYRWISKTNPEPARQAILRTVRAGWPEDMQAGLDAERSEFLRLVFSDDCRTRLAAIFTRKSTDPQSKQS